MLKDDLVRQGDWLFRWRWCVPLLMLPVVVLGFMESNYYGGAEGIYGEAWKALCFIVALLGLAIRVLVVGRAPSGTSGRITKHQKASRLNTTGLYSLCRNPLYLGNFFMNFGVLLFLNSIFVLAIFTLFFWLYYERVILREEDFLEGKFGDEYRAWAGRTPVFIPRFSRWISPDLPFSWRTVLRREYTGLFAVVAALTTMELAGGLLTEGKLSLGVNWRAVFAFGLAAYLILRSLKKYTRLLHEPGR